LPFFSGQQAAVGEMARVVRAGGSVCVATWAGLSETPGYAAMVELLDDLFGPSLPERSPHRTASERPRPYTTPSRPASTRSKCIGSKAWRDSRRLTHGSPPMSTLWTLRDMLDNDQLAELCAQARIQLHEFCDPAGLVTFPAPALVAIMRP
jgi:hypothetical protein